MSSPTIIDNRLWICPSVVSRSCAMVSVIWCLMLVQNVC